MKIKDWAKCETRFVIKKLSIIFLVFLLPTFVVLLYTYQFFLLKATVDSKNQNLLIAVQTGDLIAIEKGVYSYKVDSNVRGFVLLDSDNVSIIQSGAMKKELFELENIFKIQSGDKKDWATIKIIWTINIYLLLTIILFGFVVLAILIFIYYGALTKTSFKLISSIEEIRNSIRTNEVPRLVSEFEDLQEVISELAKVQKLQIDFEQSKAKSEKEKSLVKLSQKIAHDIRSPLSVFNLVLGRKDDLREGDRELLLMASNRVAEIAEQLLEERKSQLTSAETFDVAIMGVICELKSRLEGRALNIKLDDICNRICIPNSEFKSVLSNLIINALEATDLVNGKIDLIGVSKANRIALKLRDNGCGIPIEILHKIGKEEVSYNKGNAGNGLGLFNAKHWINLVGGDLFVTSSVGFGTEVLLEIPF